ncbi:pyridoxamine 5'-phosphate oxidase-related FMN-binding protein [Fibrella aestuarina BUZ 2]|uniref:Pyridoxamine 5'-phosphate oxidase-related FMN-binding protein n=1 Tax=Fibrella aestuarina BUZ 2 TaxID=1166018 RepID=I0KGK8_9BACT|nr:pyridoxamine 5'-phosphate oxidase family protein [Fibrella aestuarina]CCH03261.1 pyridoxamine 5'-phosphate oxidase-related FMN-binding protein [Fibrella aestuarina BUZ 2]
MQTPRTTPSRLAKRTAYDTETIYSILDEGLFCTVSYVLNGQPMAIPTAYARHEDRLYIHGSVGSHFIRSIENGASVCISVMLADGLVLAKSAFSHSVNYRSVVVMAQAEKVTDESECLHALTLITDHLIPGRWADLRATTDSELRKTTVLAFSLAEASAKVRTGGPNDDPGDVDLPTWAGVIPLETSWGTPIAATYNIAELPSYLG